MKTLGLIAFAIFACGCSSDPTPIQPRPPVTSDAGSTPLAAPPRRAFHRNPFGDVAQTDNLFVDGDFEITGRTDQAPWIVQNSSAQQTLNYDTGGRCRSGLRCAVIGTGDIIIGLMSSPVNEDYEISIYIQPDTQRCADATVFTIDVGASAESASISSLTTAPDVDGWCHFAGKAANLAYEQPALYVSIASNAKAKTLHIDQGTALPMSETPVHGALPPPVRPSAAEQARIDQATAFIRSHRKFGRTAPKETR